MMKFSLSLAMISKHIIRSSARYLFALEQGTVFLEVENSSFAPSKKVFNGSPSIQAQRNVLKAPGSTETKPNKDSVALSR
jgi:hypothetical protein